MNDTIQQLEIDALNSLFFLVDVLNLGIQLEPSFWRIEKFQNYTLFPFPKSRAKIRTLDLLLHVVKPSPRARPLGHTEPPLDV